MAVEPIRAAGCVVWRHPTGGEDVSSTESVGGGLADMAEEPVETVPANREFVDAAADPAPPMFASPGVELALVHRPRYDDWSFPKGKLESDEHDDPLRAALREVLEETGLGCQPDVPLPTQHYLVNGRPKEVRYWAAESTGGMFVPNEEVDRLVWLPPTEARALLTYEHDRALVDALLTALRERTPGSYTGVE